MRHLTPILCTIIILLSLSSCTGNSRLKTLQQAETIVDDSPDSVLNLLSTLPEKSLSQEERAYYGLLLTQSLFKCEKPIGNDSLIDYSIVYFKQQNDKEHLATSYYYKGAVNYIRGNFKTSVTYLKYAEEKAEQTNNLLLKNKIYEVLYYANFDNECYDLALSYAKKFLDTSFKIKDEDLISRGLTAVSTSYNMNQERDSAILYINQSLSTIDKSEPKFQAAIYATIAALYYESRDTAQCVKFLQKAFDIYDYPYSHFIMGLLYHDKGQESKAKESWEKALATEDTHLKSLIHERLAQLYAAQGKYEEAYYYTGQQLSILNQTKANNDTKRILEIQTRLDAEQKERRLYQRISILLLSMIVISFLASLLFLHHRRKLRTLRMTMSANEERLENYQQEIDKNLKQIKKLQASDRTRQKKINTLVDQINSLRQSIHKQILLGGKFYQEIVNNKPCNDYTDKEIEALLDFYMIVHEQTFLSWTQKYQKISPRQFLFLIMEEMGKKDHEMARILCVTESSIRSIRSRLKKKLT